MGDVVLVDGLAQPFGAVNVAGDLDVLLVLAFDALGVVVVTEFFGGVVTINGSNCGQISVSALPAPGRGGSTHS